MRRNKIGRMTDLMRVTIRAVLLHNSYSEETVKDNSLKKNKRRRRGGFPVADPGELTKLNHKSP